jgi:pimeloyl-ACP methyl ester carboxylesterase
MAVSKRKMGDVVVLLPGITGSVLRKDGRDVWGMTPGGAARALLSLGRSIGELRLKGDDAEDGITAPLVMPDLHLIPGLWKIDGYSKVSRYILDTFGVVPQENFFQFPYDWRRDNRIAARQLKAKTDRWLHAWRQQNPEAKLILVGHSMGGLVARYFLECLEGWRDTRALVTFGTPYRGSLNALNFLAHGMKKSLGPVTLLDLSGLVRSFTSVYQLLPIYPCVDPGDGTLIRPSESSGIPGLDPGRVRAADGFHREIENAVAAHLDDDGYRRNRYVIHPVVGTFQPTLLSARASAGRVQMLDALPGYAPDGDGTVPRVSATPIEFAHEEGAMFAAERHGSLQNNDGVLIQLAGILSGQDTSRVRAGSDIGLDIDDAFGPGEPVTFRARSKDPMAPLTAVLTAADPGQEVDRCSLGAAPGWQQAELAPLRPGTYRLTIAGEGAEPVTDTFVVFGAEYPETSAAPGSAEGSTRGLPAEERRTRGEPAVVAEDRAPEAVADPVLEQRYLQGRFPGRVRLGEVVSLLVRLGLSAGEQFSSRLTPVSVFPQGTDITLVLLESPGFRPRSQRAALRVFPGQDSDWALFDLEAVTEGVHTLRVLAFAGGTALGELTVQATVDSGVATSALAEHTAPAGGAPRDPGEVSLLIRYDRDRAVYRYQLIDWSGEVPEEAASNQLLQAPSQAVESLVQQLNALARGAAPWDAATTLDWLKNQGIALWRGFIPEALQREFWARRDRITRMTIISSGDPVPWELLYPFSDAGHDAGFLIDQFPVARRLGKMPPHRLKIASADVVLSGAESLAAAPGEMQALTALLGARNIAATTITDVSALLGLLRKGEFGLLHFTCHNAFSASAPNACRIMLGSQPFEPVFLEQHAGRFTAAAPLVFMNACRTDGQAPLYTTMDGWALSFLRAGAGAFIGSLWEVVDSSASAYAQEFYRAALSGDTLGEAARKAREAIRQEPGDPTWLAYTLYGDPAATIGAP